MSFKELFSNPNKFKSDCKMVESAMTNKYPITPEIRQLIVAKMAVALGKSPKLREQIAASRVLLAVDQLNSKREADEETARGRKELLDEHRRARILAVANRLGIAGTIDGTATRRPDGYIGGDASAASVER